MAGRQEELFTGKGASPDDTVAVNARCLMRTRDGHRVVLVAGIVLCQYSVGDYMAEAHGMVSLVEQGWADQREVGVPRSTMSSRPWNFSSACTVGK